VQSGGDTGVRPAGGARACRGGRGAGPARTRWSSTSSSPTSRSSRRRSGRATRRIPSMLPPLAAILGTASAGRWAMGSPWAGRRVVASLNGTGGYAERAVSPRGPADSGSRTGWPTRGRGSRCWPMGRTALALARHADLGAGETIVVEGGGRRGGNAARADRPASGARVVALAGQPRKLALARDLGAELNRGLQPGRPGRGQVRDLVGEVDVVFDGVGGDIRAGGLWPAPRGGRFCPFGMASGSFAPGHPRDLARDRQVTVRAGAGGSPEETAALARTALARGGGGAAAAGRRPGVRAERRGPGARGDRSQGDGRQDAADGAALAGLRAGQSPLGGSAGLGRRARRRQGPNRAGRQPQQAAPPWQFCRALSAWRRNPGKRPYPPGCPARTGRSRCRNTPARRPRTARRARWRSAPPRRSAGSPGLEVLPVRVVRREIPGRGAR